MKILSITKENGKRVVGGSLPDIDIDHCYEGGQDVKDYLHNKYKETANVGTYGKMKLKNSLTDIAKLFGVEYGTLKKITKQIPNETQTIGDLIKLSLSKPILKTFIKNNPEVFYATPLVMGSLRNKSTHASAYIILPKIKEIYDWIPVRLDGDGHVTTEWEGDMLDKSGILKQDILRLRQLTKMFKQLDLIKEKYHKDIDIFKVPLDDPKVYEHFSKGLNEDVFQFGADGLSGYIEELKPENINDLIAGVSLFRPGAMESNTHNEFLLRRHGKKEIECLNGWEDLTSDTYGLLYLQEQVMRILQKIGSFDLEITDLARKALGKKNPELLNSFETKFVENGVKNGYTEDELRIQWDFIKVTSGYLFNKSHAAAYADLGYRSMWLKVNYPLPFWSTAINFAKDNSKSDELIPNYISEIYETGHIKVLAPDINKSHTDVLTDFETETIYWPLSSVKQVGEVATNQIVADREEKGEYFSFDEFLSRHKFKGSKVTKQIIEHLVLSGAFDIVERQTQPTDRLKLIEHYRKKEMPKIDKTKDLFFLNESKKDYRWWWVLQQKVLSGIAFFDYKTLVEDIAPKDYPFVSPDTVHLKSNKGNKVTVAGYIVYFDERTSKKGLFARVVLEQNYKFVQVTIWPDDYQRIKENITESEKCLMFISGVIGFDSYRKENILFSDRKTDVLILT